MTRAGRVVGLGEVLMDVFPDGRRVAGGAPMNVAWYAGRLGARPSVLGAVGRDPDGDELRRRLAAMGLDLSALRVDDGRPTGTVAVSLSADGQPSYAIAENAAWDRPPTDAAALAAMAGADAVAYGSLAQRTPEGRAAVAMLLAATRPDCLRVFDVNIRPPFFGPSALAEGLARATLFKLNDQEWPTVRSLLDLPASGDDEAEALAAGLAALFARFPALRWTALTRGAAGAELFCAPARAGAPAARVSAGAPTVRVVDAVGAGDAFTASLTMSLLAGRADAEALGRACALGAYVCTCPGATAELPASGTSPFYGDLNGR